MVIMPSRLRQVLTATDHGRGGLLLAYVCVMCRNPVSFCVCFWQTCVTSGNLP